MSYHSTIPYYTIINVRIQKTLGGASSASLILHSFNHAELSTIFTQNRWDEVTTRFIHAGKHMRAAGAQGIAIGCKIGHKVASEVEVGTSLPVLHIADFAANALRKQGLRRIALLATRAVMEDGFIKNRLRDKAGFEVLVPQEVDRIAIDNAVFQELGAVNVTEATKDMMIRVVEDLSGQGADGVVLPCTDLQSVLKAKDFSLPILDILQLHAERKAWRTGQVVARVTLER